MSLWNRIPLSSSLQWTWCRRRFSTLRRVDRSSTQTLPLPHLDKDILINTDIVEVIPRSNAAFRNTKVFNNSSKNRTDCNSVVDVLDRSSENNTDHKTLAEIPMKRDSLFDFTQLNSNFVREELHNFSDLEVLFNKIKLNRESEVPFNSFSLDNFFHDLDLLRSSVQNLPEEQYEESVNDKYNRKKCDPPMHQISLPNYQIDIKHKINLINKQIDKVLFHRKSRKKVSESCSNLREYTLNNIIQLPKRRPPNPFAIYLTYSHAQLKLTGEGDGISGRDRVKLIGQRWNSLPKWEKQIFIDRGNKLLKEYHELLCQTALDQKVSVEKLLFLPKCRKAVPSPYTLYHSVEYKKAAKTNLGKTRRDLLRELTLRYSKLPAQERKKYNKMSEDLKNFQHYKLEEYKDSLPKNLRPHIDHLIQQQIILRKAKRQFRYRESIDLGRPRQVVPTFARFRKSLNNGVEPNDKIDLKMSKNMWQSLSHKEKLPFIKEYEKDFAEYCRQMYDWEKEMIKIGRLDLLRLKSRKALGLQKLRK